MQEGDNCSSRFDLDATGRRLLEDFRLLSQEILSHANWQGTRAAFLANVSELLIDFFGCDSVEIRVRVESRNCARSAATRQPQRAFSYVVVHSTEGSNVDVLCGAGSDCLSVQLCRQVLTGSYPPSSPCHTKNGSFWTNDTKAIPGFGSARELDRRFGDAQVIGDHRSLAIVPLVVVDENAGLLIMKSLRCGFFSAAEMAFVDSIAETVGLSLAHHQAQAALAERVKELTCLYAIARIVQEPGIQLDEIFHQIVALLPPGWQYPEIAHGRIVLDGQIYSTCDFEEHWQKQSADIIVKRQPRGVVEVAYSTAQRVLDEGPFLKEERKLIVAIATQVAAIVERQETEEERATLQVQLRHADRLATIGQLAAGVAHELNEPLGSILGFAQLATKCPGLPEQASEDIDRIIAASLHAREVITKLLIFARQVPSEETAVDLNEVVHEGLYFFEARCAKEGISLVRRLSPDLPRIAGDPAQLRQVLTNLVVNALQAMSQGGTLRVTTLSSGGFVLLSLEDTGSGMNEEVMDKLFLPFFTTKDVNEGTGLGLAVVHGIIASHGGSIDVQSEVGKGSRFEVRLPAGSFEDANAGG